MLLYFIIFIVSLTGLSFILLRQVIYIRKNNTGTIQMQQHVWITALSGTISYTIKTIIKNAIQFILITLLNVWARIINVLSKGLEKVKNRLSHTFHRSEEHTSELQSH